MINFKILKGIKGLKEVIKLFIIYFYNYINLLVQLNYIFINNFNTTIYLIFLIVAFYYIYFKNMFLVNKF